MTEIHRNFCVSYQSESYQSEKEHMKAITEKKMQSSR